MKHDHTDPIRQATIEVLSGLIPVVDRLGRQEWGHGFSGRALLLTMIGGAIRPNPSVSASIDADGLRQDLRRLRAFVDSMPRRDDALKGTDPAYLAEFVDLALSRTDMSVDKLARWVGYVEGCLEANGAPSLFLEWEGCIVGDVFAPGLVNLSRFVGFVQGVLTARDALDVAAERERTRPIFHAAYAASGMDRPATLEVTSR